MAENQDANSTTGGMNRSQKKEEEKTIRIKEKEEFQASLQEVTNFLQRLLDKIASRFVKT